MKIGIKTAIAAFFIVISTACSEDTEYRIDESLETETFEAITPMTMRMNSWSTAAAVSDGRYDYYRKLEEDYLTLCKKDRKSKEVTVLVRQPWSEDQTGEVVFSELYLKDNYLYFVLFDYNAGMENAWCRVPVDGSAPYEVLSEFGYAYSGMFFDGEKVYISKYGWEEGEFDTLNLLEVETGEISQVCEIPDDLDPRFFYEGYLYCYVYKQIDGVLHTQICRWALDDSEPELIWDTYGSPQCLAYGFKLYVVSYDTGELFEMDLDGTNRKRLLQYNELNLLNVHNGVLYLRIMEQSSLKQGIYSYTPGDKMPFPVYQSDHIVFGPIITGTGDIWFTTQIEGSRFRFGQLGYVDRYNNYHAL